MPLPNFRIDQESPISTEVRRAGIHQYRDLVRHVRELLYGRTPSSGDPTAVLRSFRGTCSSKHLLLASIANEYGFGDIHLTVGIYPMREENSPGVGNVLAAAGLESLPEAHTYLTFEEERYDFTGLRGGTESVFESLYEEHFLTTGGLHPAKEILHRSFLEHWSANLGRPSEEIWKCREACIAALSRN